MENSNYNLAKKIFEMQKNILESGEKLIQKQYNMMNKLNESQKELSTLNNLENLSNYNPKKLEEI